MTQWWEALSAFQQVMVVLAGTATIIMTVFLLLMLFGVEGNDAYDGDADVDGTDVDAVNDEPISAFSGLRIVTVRGVLAFLAVGGWTAYALSDVIGPWLAVLCGIAAGALATYLLALALRASMKLESSGNVDYGNAVGKTATVYIKVPKAGSGSGKVTLTVQEHFIEADAVSEGDEDLVTGTIVEVTGVRDENTLVVRRK